MAQLKLLNIRAGYSPIFRTGRVAENYLKNIKHNSLYFTPQKHARVFVFRHYLFLETHSFPRAVHFSEQIISEYKYSNIVLRQVEAIIYMLYD